MGKNIDRSCFKDKHLIIVVTHRVKNAVILSLSNLLEIAGTRDDVISVIIDSASEEPEIRDFLSEINQERVLVQYLDRNLGKPHAANQFIADNIGRDNLPKTVISIDPDVLFDGLSFDCLTEAVQNIDGIGMLGMRYQKNCCNPEIYLFFPPKNITGKNGKTYSVIFPFMANVAGPIFALPGKLLADPLNFRFYPVTFTQPYGPDDAALHDFLRKRGYKNGYLNGTLAVHLKSGNKQAEELINWKPLSAPIRKPIF